MNTHRIHRVAKLTGLSRDVIRVWERRYGLIKPLRGSNRYRIYTDEDVALLRYVREEMEKGNSIGDMAAMGRDTLLARMREAALNRPIPESPYERLLTELLATLDPLDRLTFEQRLNGAIAVIPFEEALVRILLPLQERVGQLWHDGRLGVAVEHYVTKQVQQKLFAVMNQLPVREDGPKVVVACPPDQWHEIGAQAVAYRCWARGCRVYYLGPNVPVYALAKLCEQVTPDLAVLSFTVALSAQDAAALAKMLAEQIGMTCPVIAGGKGALAMKESLEKAKIEVIDDFAELERRLVVLSSKR
jgi:DNA-binding transcriptional MerR regulator/methylmalonyl-CoA mutase cobalamin-binding subunit